MVWVQVGIQDLRFRLITLIHQAFSAYGVNHGWIGTLHDPIYQVDHGIVVILSPADFAQFGAIG